MNGQLLNYVEKIAHVGIAVPDIAKAQKQYELLGFCEDSDEIIEEEEYGVRVKMMSCGDTHIELQALQNVSFRLFVLGFRGSN